MGSKTCFEYYQEHDSSVREELNQVDIFTMIFPTS